MPLRRLIVPVAVVLVAAAVVGIYLSIQQPADTNESPTAPVARLTGAPADASPRKNQVERVRIVYLNETTSDIEIGEVGIGSSGSGRLPACGIVDGSVGLDVLPLQLRYGRLPEDPTQLNDVDDLRVFHTVTFPSVTPGGLEVRFMAGSEPIVTPIPPGYVPHPGCKQ